MLSSNFNAHLLTPCYDWLVTEFMHLKLNLWCYKTLHLTYRCCYYHIYACYFRSIYGICNIFICYECIRTWQILIIGMYLVSWVSCWGTWHLPHFYGIGNIFICYECTGTWQILIIGMYLVSWGVLLREQCLQKRWHMWQKSFMTWDAVRFRLVIPSELVLQVRFANFHCHVVCKL